MSIVSRAGAAHLGVSQRQVQRLAERGRLISHNVAGRRVLAPRSLLAISRTSGRGRRWDQRTVAAACELLARGSTEQLTGSQRSRLRARLRAITIPELAYQVLGDRVSLWRRTRKTTADGDTTGTTPDGFTSTGSTIEVKVTANARALSRRDRLVEDLEGDVVVLEIDLQRDASTIAADLALYAYGDERTSSAAKQRVAERIATLV